MKEYQEPTVEIVIISVEDVITTSYDGGTELPDMPL